MLYDLLIYLSCCGVRRVTVAFSLSLTIDPSSNEAPESAPALPAIRGVSSPSVSAVFHHRFGGFCFLRDFTHSRLLNVPVKLMQNEGMRIQCRILKGLTDLVYTIIIEIKLQCRERAGVVETTWPFVLCRHRREFVH